MEEIVIAKIKGHADLSSWPPDWAGFFSGSDKLAVGEVGVVRGVKLMQPVKDNPPYLSIEIEYEGNCAVGVVISKNKTTLEAVHEKMKANVGRTVAEVGQLEV